MAFIPSNDDEQEQMRAALGLAEGEELFDQIPPEVPRAEPQLPEPVSELELLQEVRELAARNQSTQQLACFLGAGAYEHFIPAAVGALTARGEFLTSYTPYQAEASQGNLQASYEFQTTVCELTGMEVANASMYDGASALAEAALMAARVTRKPRLLVGELVHPHYRATIDAYLSGLDIKYDLIPALAGVTDLAAMREMLGDDVAAVLLQSPNFLGFLEPMAEVRPLLGDADSLFVACVNPVSLGVVAPPGEYGADIAVGELQPLGMPLSFGGPYAGFFACRQEMVHQMPGRLVGATQDAQGRRGFVLTLQAREQHIRRAHATSNICSNQNLCALAATIHCALLGTDGLRQVGEANLANAHYLAERLSQIDGCEVVGEAPFFNEFPLRLPADAEAVARILLDEGLLAGLPLGRYFPERADQLLVCATELRSQAEMDRFAELLEKVLHEWSHDLRKEPLRVG